MKILFIGIGFYEYDAAIKECFEKSGHTVDYFSEQLITSRLDKIKMKTDCNFKFKKTKKIQKNILTVSSNDYDVIFVVKGENLDIEFLNTVKNQNKQAKTILYLWDDIHRIDNFEQVKNFYDQIYSFDLNDCNKYNLQFLPLFYLEKYKFSEKDKKQNKSLYFAGWNHSDRIAVLDSILKNIVDLKLNIYLTDGILNYLKTIARTKKINKYIHFKNLSLAKNIENMKKAEFVIDIQHPSQNGLTLRTIEALAAECKLITTNKNVENYDFYSSKNILIVDREDINIPQSFFELDYQKVDQEIVEQYSLKSFTKKILGE